MIERSNAKEPRQRRYRRSRKTIAAIAVAAASAGIAGVAVADDGTPPPASPSAVPMVTSVSPEQSAAFAVLRQAGGPTTAAGHGPFGANLALGRRVDTPVGPVWVVPANGTVCLRAQDAAGAGWVCAPTDVAAQHVLMLSLRPPDGSGDVTVFGLVPDQAGTAQLATASGTTDLTLQDGVFGTTVDAQDHASVITEGVPEQPVP